MEITGEKEYFLHNVKRAFLSDECITPYNVPRATQPSVSKYIGRKDGKKLYRDREIAVHESILDLWAKRGRCDWVDKPEIDGFHMHELAKKYSINYDFEPSKRPHKMFFPRSNIFELKYLKDIRRDRINRNQNYNIDSIQKSDEEIKKKKEEKDEASLEPFWWNAGKSLYAKEDPDLKSMKKTVDGHVCVCCERRKLMHRVGKTFKQDCLMYYNEHYPHSRFLTNLEKFSK